MFEITHETIVTFLQVILIDLVLAGDNAVVIGLAAAGLPREQRGRAIFIGIIAATVLRIVFAVFIVQLMAIVGLLLAGGILLLWVCWKMWRELRQPGDGGNPESETAPVDGVQQKKSFAQAAMQIVVADVSMSLDNALAVAGAARDHLPALIFGLALSVALMGFAATYVARLLERYRWIAFVGLAIIFYVACDMIWRGALEIQARAFGG